MTDMNTHLSLVSNIEIKVNGTRLDEEVMDILIDAEVDQSIDGPAMFTLRFVDNDDFKLINSETFDLGKPVEIGISPSLDITPASIFKGEVTALEPYFGATGNAELVVRGYDKSHRLYRDTVSKTWVQVKDSEIAQAIASKIGLSPEIDTTTVVHKHIYQYAQNDMAFLKQRAQRIGYDFWVDDEKLYFKKASAHLGQAGDLEWGTTLTEFTPSLSVAHQVDEVEVRGWDPQKKAPIVGSAKSSTTNPTIGYGKWGGAAGQSSIAAAKRLEVRQPVADKAEADLIAQAILDSINGEFVTAHGTAFGDTSIKVGWQVNITKVGTRFGGKYKVTACRHTYTPAEGYMTSFTVRGTATDTLADYTLNDTQSNADRWGGVVPAIVTDLASPELDYGVVKVKYPWLDESQQSHWARVTLLGGGTGGGMFVMPEIGDEVLVAFEHGDFNRPYILGGLYNGKDKPVEANNTAFANGNVEVRTLHTRTGHKIRFVESSSESSIEIVDAEENTRILLDGKNKLVSITSQDLLDLFSVGDMSLGTQGNLEIKATGNIVIEATGNLELKGNMVKTTSIANTELSATGNMTVKSTGMMSVQGTGPTEVKSPAILTIQGSLVKIN